MRLLLLTPQPPYPAHQGTAIRNWGILRHLSAHHAVSLLSFAPPNQSVPAAELAAACASIEFVPLPRHGLGARMRTLATGRADLADRLWSPAFNEALQRILRASQFDLIQIEGLELAGYLSTVQRCSPATPVIYDAHNAEISIQQRAWDSDHRTFRRWPAALYSKLQVPRLARLEAAVCRQANAVTCVSEVDAAALSALVAGLRPVVIANGLDLANYPWPPPDASAPPILTFTGKMDYRPNVDAALWFADEILPLIRLRAPSAHFEIVGQKPAPALAGLAGRQGVSVVGAVPDVRPHIIRGAVYVAPLRMGGGTRFKLLEAMALGRPVVTTTIGAEGFAVQSGREVLIADSPTAFADQVLQILADPTLANRLSLAGRQFVEARYDWASIIPRLESLQQQLVAGRAALVV